MMKRHLCSVIFAAAVLCLTSYALAEDSAGLDTSPPSAEELFPYIKPEIAVWTGYRLIEIDGTSRIEEYQYNRDSFMFGSDVRFSSYPNRFHLDVNLENKKTYFGDIWYAYKDIFFIRGINSTIYHNLQNSLIEDLDPSTPSPGVLLLDGGDDFGIRSGMSTFYLRLKAPDFPLHIFVNGDVIDKDGSRQQRSMQGAGYFNNNLRVSEGRDVDWLTRDLYVGANAHLGPVEVEYTHGEKRFTSGGDEVLYGSYTAAGFPPTPIRQAGVYPHNLIPDIESSSNTLKFHTSYTGRLVASASFSFLDKENRYSGAEAEYFIGSGEVTWIPTSRIAFFLKYRHRASDIDNPDSVLVADLSDPSNTYGDPDVRPSISSDKDTVSLTGRFRPFSRLALSAKYVYDDIRRENAEEWELPKSTQRNTASLSADLRVMKGLKMKAKYTFRDTNDPANNAEPDRSDEGMVGITWSPAPLISANISYTLAEEDRENLHFIDTHEPDDRDVTRDRLIGSVTVIVHDDVSLTAGYAYFHNKIVQDLEYHNETGIPFVDYSVPYRDTARSYLFDVFYMPKDHISLNAGITFTESRGSFRPDEINLTQPVSIASSSKFELRETVFSGSMDYSFGKGYASGLRYRYIDLNDVLDNPYDDIEDGDSHLVLITISKEW